MVYKLVAYLNRDQITPNPLILVFAYIGAISPTSSCHVAAELHPARCHCGASLSLAFVTYPFTLYSSHHSSTCSLFTRSQAETPFPTFAVEPPIGPYNNIIRGRQSVYAPRRCAPARRARSRPPTGPASNGDAWRCGAFAATTSPHWYVLLLRIAHYARNSSKEQTQVARLRYRRTLRVLLHLCSRRCVLVWTPSANLCPSYARKQVDL